MSNSSPGTVSKILWHFTGGPIWNSKTNTQVVQHGFNPVLYTLPTTEVIRHIYEGLSSMESIDSGEVVTAAESLESNLTNELDEYSEITIDTSDVVAEAEIMEEYAQEAQSSIRDFIAFIKTFEEDQFDSIYCEREWRSVQDFKFTFDDVTMIVTPKRLGQENYFQDLLGSIRELRIPRKIPIVPWEDLVEN